MEDEISELPIKRFLNSEYISKIKVNDKVLSKSQFRVLMRNIKEPANKEEMNP